MERQHALNVLGLRETSDRRIIKKKYRALMHVVHPDAQAAGGSSYEYSAHEINAAYEVLMNAEESPETIFKKKKSGEKKRWNAPVNESAYAEREIYGYAEGADGTRQGLFTIARGKFIRIPDEDQKLFLLSIYNLSRSLLEDCGERMVMRYQAELAYLLLQQYTDPERDLERYLISQDKDEQVYYIPSMLETGGKRNRLQEGDTLYPSAVRDHRLYVRNEAGNELGYVSFSDDMLYQTVVPLFENRSVQVKIRVSGRTYGNNSVRKIVVKNLDLWVKAVPRDDNEVALSINSKIEALLTCASK